MLDFEFQILDFIQNTFRCAFLDVLMPFISSLTNAGIDWILLAAVLLIFPKTRKTGLALGIALLIGVILGNAVLKNAFDRIRPFEYRPETKLLIEPLYDGSFPSGHALASFEGAVSIRLKYKGWGRVALVFAFLTAFSRLYLYVHFPTDVLGGILLGTAFAFLAAFIVDKIYPYIEAWLSKFSKSKNSQE